MVRGSRLLALCLLAVLVAWAGEAVARGGLADGPLGDTRAGPPSFQLDAGSEAWADGGPPPPSAPVDTARFDPEDEEDDGDPHVQPGISAAGRLAPRRAAFGAQGTHALSSSSERIGRARAPPFAIPV